MKFEKENFYERLIHSNYDLFYYLFYNHSPGWTAELLLSITETLQLLSFTFGQQVNYNLIYIIFSLKVFGKKMNF